MSWRVSAHEIENWSGFFLSRLRANGKMDVCADGERPGGISRHYQPRRVESPTGWLFSFLNCPYHDSLKSILEAIL
jgi:hypothetical protein